MNTFEKILSITGMVIMIVFFILTDNELNRRSLKIKNLEQREIKHMQLLGLIEKDSKNAKLYIKIYFEYLEKIKKASQ